ncbi:sulfurtransferase-like selenium metabolism protein YedF [uncultured Brachyspira sp.]|uniref:sulfurtransferase-like selenium metabolism protein YedF n=1 Tax=uncultured Brachyspira sp. TaxID=221953 RepID=UPI0025DFC04D|nr:sulfurtransferase-like selenium metabolism protein YedF [uncultured Brachyspira sp.]
MKTIDARGIPCPKPLILTKTSITNAALNEEIEILIDDDTAFHNIKDFLNNNAITYTNEGQNFKIIKNKDISSSNYSNIEKFSGPVIAVADKKVMGAGNDELGELLLKAFLGALKDASPKPEALYCYNGGVYLGAEEPYKTLLQELRDAGIKIFFCGTCVKFYKLDEIKTEEQTNMLGIIEAMGNASAVIRA